MHRQVNGILLLDKPVNLTSNGALQIVKRLYNAKKAGHTGSLDPIATGMLPICFGEATKFSQFLLESDKSYHVIAKLGECTTTGDCEGEVIMTQSISGVNTSQIENIMNNFLGEIEQIPPMFSAIKYQGKPLYQLARQGIKVDRKPRKITIYAMELVSFNEEQSTICFNVHCSKGTYIRTLAEDIGKELGCGAHVIELRRVAVTPYNASNMFSLTTLEYLAKDKGYTGLSECLLPIETAVEIFPAVKLSASAAFYMRTGQAVRANFQLDSALVRLLSEDAKFLGMGEVLADGRVKPLRLLSTNLG
ncbi:MAG: tRNA pseudouridine(55) synthase TruB [Gammaproteobacteria bacterium RIFCSPHIGHO2_12_FULL_37_14]|nr:MAG: tRNA pseudouridine(55) synthase TruB [Gammaproteobacteria bacterium RIFCSPHIGHO2_12_FULL_37_14]